MAKLPQRIVEQSRREDVNRKRGFTGKQLDNAMRKYGKLHGLSYRTVKDLAVTEVSKLDIASQVGLI